MTVKKPHIGRRKFLKVGTAGATGVLLADVLSKSSGKHKITASPAESGSEWPVLKSYSKDFLHAIALPLGGIGTGTVSLGGRGDLRDWEIMNRPSKGFIPQGGAAPFFCVYVNTGDNKKALRALEGPLELTDYDDDKGSSVPNHGLPRFRNCSFDTAYPFGIVNLSDPDMPVDVSVKAFNPLIPGNADASGIPVAVLKYELYNKTNRPIKASVCGNIPNFIGNDGVQTKSKWDGNPQTVGEKDNHNRFRKGKNVQGIFMQSEGVSRKAEQWGTLALTTSLDLPVTYRTSWVRGAWGGPLLDFWDDFSEDGRLDERENKGENNPMASLSVEIESPARSKKEVVYFITWHFPNRYTWTPKPDDKECCPNGECDGDRIGNYYTTQYSDAWEVAEKETPRIPHLEQETLRFVRTLCESDLPPVVKEAALFNTSTLRTQTCFRLPDGHLFGFEGCSNQHGCCHGSCTHVWNYEQATAFLFGDLARSMRDIEFTYATEETGMMNFRTNLPLERAQDYDLAAADGQMGCIMKIYRDWQLSGDDDFLKNLWPKVKKAMEFCWIEGGWDGDRDGVMEGCQHNTMDVEYFGPNPQMGIWYLGALRAAEEMARYQGEEDFAGTCRRLFEGGSAWLDANLFNGEYYEHEIRPPEDESKIAKGLRHTMGARNMFSPDYQLGAGCLVDQLVGQFLAHVCGLGYLVNEDHVRTTLKSIMKHNHRKGMHDHFNNMRSYVLGDESSLLMASYPKERPKYPFPYFLETMTGFEYTAAIGMLYEGQMDNGLQCIRNIRDRYDGLKRNPFDEAECGHHYARAMASWAAVLALTGFYYSGVEKKMTFKEQNGSFFWSNGYAWGNCSLKKSGSSVQVELSVLSGELKLQQLELQNFGLHKFDREQTVKAGEKLEFSVARA